MNVKVGSTLNTHVRYEARGRSQNPALQTRGMLESHRFENLEIRKMLQRNPDPLLTECGEAPPRTGFSASKRRTRKSISSIS